MTKDISIIRTPVSSSHITEIGYDPLMENLIIRFKNGDEYTYCGVPSTIYEKMKKAESMGRFFMENIKNRYDFLKKRAKKETQL